MFVYSILTIGVDVEAKLCAMYPTQSAMISAALAKPSDTLCKAVDALATPLDTVDKPSDVLDKPSGRTSSILYPKHACIARSIVTYPKMGLAWSCSK